MLHRFAQLTAAATFILLLVGGLVHGTGSSLACPDWPLCHGQVFPKMVHGVEYEHSHRLAAAAVSVLTMTLSGWLLYDKRYRRLRALAVAAPAMVLAQALLGGLTVLFKLPLFITLSHLTLSMCFFSVTLLIAVATRRTDEEAYGAGGAPVCFAGLRGWVAAAGASVLGQILLGGVVRHTMSGLACTTFPFCFGNVWPPSSSSSGSERIHMIHRFGAVCVGVFVTCVAVAVLRRAKAASGPEASFVRSLAIAAPILVLVQITLGVLSVTSLLHLPIVEAHLGVAAMLLGTMVTMWARLAPAVARPAAAAHPARDEAVPA